MISNAPDNPAYYFLIRGRRLKMSKFLPHSPEISTAFGNLSMRQDLINHSVTIGLRDYTDWHLDTEQVQISSSIIHFIQPDGELVGLKVFS